MKQKIDQGSSQEDGEIQELIIEKHLRETCPQDKIEEIKKGVTGADTLQIINYDDPQNEVKILYESKNTKVYKEEWIDKLKKDMVGEGASMGVLVTKTFPSGMKKIGVKRGIYILSPLEFKSIIPILRHEVIRSNNLIKATNNKGEKKEMLYQYLIGDAFRLHLESILEAVIDSKNDIEKEKRSLNSIWKKREQQLQKITINFASIYGGIRGIAGNSSFPEMQQFELEEKKKLS